MKAICLTWLLVWLATAASDQNVLSLPAISPQLCSNKSHNRKSFQYDYNSRIVGFANATKYLVFTARFDLTCVEFRNDRYEFQIEFLQLATKMQSNKTSTATTRDRKVPIKSVTTSSSSATTSRTIGSRPLQATEDKWYPLSLRPVRFYQSINGTITDIYIHNEDHDRHSEDESIKKAIAFMFQTWRNPSDFDPFEEDDLGQHFTRYSAKKSTNNRTIVKKSVQPDDFVKMQFDSINYNQIELYVEQAQTIRNEDGFVESSKGRISTQPIAKNEQIPFGVIVSFTLKLTQEFENSLNQQFFERDFVKFTRNNFTKQHFDNGDNLLQIFNKKLDSIKHQPIGRIFDEIWADPRNTGDLTAKVKSLLALESKLFRLKKMGMKTLYPKFIAIFLKNFETAYQMKRMSVVLRLLEIATGCDGAEVDKVFLQALRFKELGTSYKFAQKFLNTLVQYEYPSDSILDELKWKMLAVNNSWPKSNRESLNIHALVDLSHLVTKETVTKQQRKSVLRYFASVLEPFSRKCDVDEAKRRDTLDAVANILVPTMLERTEAQTRRLIDIVLELMMKCNMWDTSLATHAVMTLRHILDDRRQVQSGLLQNLKKTDCQTRADIVQQLTVLLDSGYRQSEAGSLKSRRSWPKHDFTAVDDYLWQSMNKSDELADNDDFLCNQNVLKTYFSKKSQSAMKQKRLFDEGKPEEESFLRRIKRQLGGADGLGGLSALSGGFSNLNPAFAPELDCMNWNSQVGSGFIPSLYDSPGKFDRDSLRFGFVKKHCLFNATFNFGSLGGAGFKAGFFSGMSNKSDGRLYGKTWLGISLIFNVEIATVSFSRELLDGKFSGEVKLDVVSTNYISEIQYTCNITKDNWQFNTTQTLPAFRVVFSGFAFVMNADFILGVNFTFWPSHCGADGSMGVRFQPIVYFLADAYAELENDYFGVGTLATISLNYFIELMTQMPSGCFYFYHGNEQMFFKFDFYLKLPTFSFINFDPTPVVLKQSYAVITWQFVIKKSSRYVIYGFCFPDLSAPPDTPEWKIGDESPDEYVAHRSIL